MSTVTDKVAEEITKLAPRVESEVVAILVNRQVKKRVDALVSVLDMVDKANKDLLKLRADMVFFNEAGEALEPVFSKSKNEEKKKLKVKIDKLEKGLTKALEKNDYEDVYNISSGKTSPEGDAGSTEGSD